MSKVYNIKGIELACASSNTRYGKRNDSLVITLDEKSTISGKFTSNSFKAAPINTGIKFIRTDLMNRPVVDASLANLDKTNRRTQLKKNNVIVQTTEHLLAAIKGLEIDNLFIEIDSDEVPILDGSSKLFSEVLGYLNFDYIFLTSS